MSSAKRVAVCGLMIAANVVIMVLGAAIGIGIYFCPMLAGLLLLPIGNSMGKKYQFMCYVAISIISAMLVPDPEAVLMFVGFMGWYPILRPRLQKLPKLLRVIVKLALFNCIMIAMEALLMLVLVPEVEATWYLILLLMLGNVMFLLYDNLIPKFLFLLQHYLGRVFKF